jgi:hypothetical protein
MCGSGLYASLGLFGAARELLRSILVLDDCGHSYFALPGLVRQVWEYTATAAWIVEDPDYHAIRLAQDTNWHVLQMANEAGHTEELDRLVVMWKGAGFPDDSFAQKMPPFSDRLVGFVRDRYPRYRNFSRFTHPTRYVVDTAFDREEQAMTFRTEAAGETPWIAFGACMIAGLATQLELSQEPNAGNSRSGLGFKRSIPEFVGLGLMLENHTKPEAEMDRSPWAEDAPRDPTWLTPTHELLAASERPDPPPRRNAPCPCGSGKKFKKCHGRTST